MAAAYEDQVIRVYRVNTRSSTVLYLARIAVYVVHERKRQKEVGSVGRITVDPKS